MQLNLRYITAPLAVSLFMLSGCSPTNEKRGFVDETAGAENLDTGLKTQALNHASDVSKLDGSANSNNGMGNAGQGGFREYPIALNEPHVKVVALKLTMQGIPASHLATASCNTTANGHDKSGWALNHRVELDYQGV